MKENTLNTTTTAETTTTAPETIGKDFPRLPFETQMTIISACLTNSAKYINDCQCKAQAETTAPESKAPESFIDAMQVRFREDEELTQETFCLCLERANNPKYESLSLAFFVSKCAGTALHRELYHGGKIQITEREIKSYYGEDASPETVIDGNAVQKTFPAPDGNIMREEMRKRILDGIRPAVRETAEKLLTGIESGFSINESARLAGISADRAGKVYQIILNSTACVLAEDGESARLEKAIESDNRTKGNLAKRIESAKAYAMKAGIIERDKKNGETVQMVKRLSYIDAIIYAGNHQAELKKLFRR